jgi:hypothetical protein
MITARSGANTVRSGSKVRSRLHLTKRDLQRLDQSRRRICELVISKLHVGRAKSTLWTRDVEDIYRDT